KLKYDVMNILCYPATVAAIYFGYPPIIKRCWLGVNAFLQGLWQNLAFHRVAESENLNQAFGVETVALMFAVLVGMWLLLGLLRLCELWCFKWKL
ncbi:MAG: hypothetical protein HYU66_26395, partial [Armatimonadetes bacterium]|nr:hypothetical protein [Armatimonadota bacterium]